MHLMTWRALSISLYGAASLNAPPAAAALSSAAGGGGGGGGGGGAPHPRHARGGVVGPCKYRYLSPRHSVTYTPGIRKRVPGGSGLHQAWQMLLVAS